MAKCLVTGHRGYIGSELFENLKQLGHDVQGIDIKEGNTEYLRDNYEIEVFLVEEVAEIEGVVEKLKPLFFEKEQERVVNGILLDDSELSSVEIMNTSRDLNYVNYYFDIFVDNEIDESVLCESIQTLKSNGYKIESEIVCPEFRRATRMSIYTSYVSEEDIDSCQD